MPLHFIHCWTHLWWVLVCSSPYSRSPPYSCLTSVSLISKYLPPICFLRYFWRVHPNQVLSPHIFLFFPVVWGPTFFWFNILSNLNHMWPRVCYLSSLFYQLKSFGTFVSFVIDVHNPFVEFPLVVFVHKILFHFRICKIKFVNFVNETMVCTKWSNCLCLFARELFWFDVRNEYLWWKKNPWSALGLPSSLGNQLIELLVRV